jgi:glycosyltransferase involved in cell wall biosynthesis
MKLFFWQKRSKQSRPLVSIITPAFNAAGTIERTIGSVLQQKYKKIEFILVDGLSSDQTPAIIRDAAAKDSRVRYTSEKDLGAYDAMNKGISMSSGDWIYFLGADDLLVHESILQELYEEEYFSQEKVFYGNVIIEGETPWAKDQEVYAGEYDLSALLKRNICHQSIFYPRRIINQAGFFNQDYVVCADWDYNLRCYAIEPFLYVDKIIARFKGGGISTNVKQDPFLEDLPGNILRCFNLDPDEPALFLPDSPFREVIDEYHKKMGTFSGNTNMNLKHK